MTEKLSDYLASLTSLSEEDQVWGNGDFAFTVRTYICQDFPPLEYVTSVRALVFHNDKLLTVTDEQATYILPGGRIEKGETLKAALRREVLEETGWTLNNICPIGFLHYRHKNLRPPEYRYLYPDFIQLIYMAEADTFQPDNLASEYEVHGLRTIDEIERMLLRPGERIFLHYAIKNRQSFWTVLPSVTPLLLPS